MLTPAFTDSTVNLETFAYIIGDEEKLRSRSTSGAFEPDVGTVQFNGRDVLQVTRGLTVERALARLHYRTNPLGLFSGGLTMNRRRKWPYLRSCR